MEFEMVTARQFEMDHSLIWEKVIMPSFPELLKT
ncbi:MAG: hypothetical protein CM1200mP28_09390 [Deltaproteobacteria bacterium]|nr:MAG: hypothetical protein CM1200mP28_09390 [Deltaproteobacteria bacterium]